MKISSFFKPLSFLPALALMYMIYTFSAQPAEVSSMQSLKASRVIVRTVDTVTQQHWDDWQVETYANQVNGLVRKCTHITEYFLLAVAVSFPLYVYGVRGLLLMLLAGLICVGYAFGDEYHQSMVAGRASSGRDVMIDSVGVFFGVILTRLLGWSGRMAITGPVYERRQNRRQKELDAREEELNRREQALRRKESGRRTESGQDRFRGRGMRPDSAQRERYQDEPVRTGAVDDRTRVFGPAGDVDDRTRVFRTAKEQERMEEEYRRVSYERRKVQSEDLQDDNTSDQLADDIPFSGLFKRK